MAETKTIPVKIIYQEPEQRREPTPINLIVEKPERKGEPVEIPLKIIYQEPEPEKPIKLNIIRS